MRTPYFYFFEKYLDRTKNNIAKELKFFDCLACASGVLGMIVSLVEHEMYLRKAVHYQEIVDSAGNTLDVEIILNVHAHVPYSTLLRSIVSFLTLVTICSIVTRYKTMWSFFKLRATIDIKTQAKRTRHFWFCLLEILYIAIHTPPKVNFGISWNEQGKDITYPFDTLVSVIIMGRIYLVWRVFYDFSFWNSNRSNQIKETLGCANQEGFAIKAEVKFRPYHMVCVLVIFSTAVLGFGLRNTEIVFLHVSRLDWYPVWNGIWCIMMSMTTVGYGDYYPTTNIGRVIIIIAALWGNFLTSLFVVALTNSIQFTFNQNQAYQMVKRGQREIVLAVKAANLLKFAILLWIRNGKRVTVMVKSQVNKGGFAKRNIFFGTQSKLGLENLKRAYIQSAIDFKKFRRNYEAYINEVTTDSVYREVKSVLLTELSHLKTRIPVYSNINKRIIENELFQILIQEKIGKLSKLQKQVFNKLTDADQSGSELAESAFKSASKMKKATEKVEQDIILTHSDRKRNSQTNLIFREDSSKADDERSRQTPIQDALKVSERFKTIQTLNVPEDCEPEDLMRIRNSRKFFTTNSRPIEKEKSSFGELMASQYDSFEKIAAKTAGNLQQKSGAGRRYPKTFAHIGELKQKAPEFELSNRPTMPVKEAPLRDLIVGMLQEERQKYNSKSPKRGRRVMQFSSRFEQTGEMEVPEETSVWKKEISVSQSPYFREPNQHLNFANDLNPFRNLKNSPPKDSPFREEIEGLLLQEKFISPTSEGNIEIDFPYMQINEEAELNGVQSAMKLSPLIPTQTVTSMENSQRDNFEI